MKKLTTSLFSLLLALASASAHANKQYNIEIIIFEDSSSRYINSEQWPIIHQLEAESALVTDSTASAEPTAGTKIQHPDDNSVLNITHHASDALAQHVTKLKQSNRYHVLLHQSWQQTGLSDTDAVDIQIDTRAEENTVTAGMTLLDSSHPAPAVTNKPLSSNVQGTIKLILGRYLHIHTDLLYSRLNSEYQPASPALNSKQFDKFKIKSQRRMRSNELHYIDHPLLGILVLVSPIE